MDFASIISAAKNAGPTLKAIGKRAPTILAALKKINDSLKGLLGKNSTNGKKITLEELDITIKQLGQNVFEQANLLFAMSMQLTNMSVLSKSFSAQIKILYMISIFSLIISLTLLVLSFV